MCEVSVGDKKAIVMQPDVYDIHPAAPEISTFVRRYMCADTDIYLDSVMAPAPTGHCYMGHIFRGECWCVVDGEESRSHTGFHISCQVDQRSFEIKYRGRLGHVMAELAPTALYRLFGLPAASIHHLAVDWSDALDSSLAQTLMDRLTNLDNIEERVAAFDAMFEALAQSATPAVPHIDEAVQIIEANGGLTTVAELCEQLSVSERNLSRRFQQVVGISPKFFARAVQLNSVVGKLLTQDEKALTELAHECGFYDQSHFIKTMQQFFRQGPREFLNGDNHMFHVFIGEFRTKLHDTV